MGVKIDHKFLTPMTYRTASTHYSQRHIYENFRLFSSITKRKIHFTLHTFKFKHCTAATDYVVQLVACTLIHGSVCAVSFRRHG